MMFPALDDAHERFAAIDQGETSRLGANRPLALAAPMIFVIEDEYFARDCLCHILRDSGFDVESFSSCESFLISYRPREGTCIVLDVHFAGMSGLELMGRIRQTSDGTPIIIVSGSSGISEAVQSMKQGASDFIEKPIVRDTLLASVRKALDHAHNSNEKSALRAVTFSHISDLTERQHQIMDRVLAGQPSKNIAADLGISQRTVENHRAKVMHKMAARSIADLVKIVISSTELEPAYST